MDQIIEKLFEAHVQHELNRKTPYFKAIYTDLVYFFFEKSRDRELDLIAEDVGVTEEMVVNELVQTLSHGTKRASAGGYLEARIRARLENFYLSPETAMLASSLTGAEKTPVKTKAPRTSATPKKFAKKPAAKKSPPKEKP